MKIFKINNNLEIVCEWKKTRNGFKHEAKLLKNGNEIDNTKISYLNRTWESFEFESVINKLLDKSKLLTNKQKIRFIQRASGEDKITTPFKSASTIALMGEIFGKTEKDKNDWKKRMLNTVPGLSFPDDFDELSEKERKRRLDGAINFGMGKTK